jgi:hypothetical protein
MIKVSQKVGSSLVYQAAWSLAIHRCHRLPHRPMHTPHPFDHASVVQADFYDLSGCQPYESPHTRLSQQLYPLTPLRKL